MQSKMLIFLFPARFSSEDQRQSLAIKTTAERLMQRNSPINEVVFAQRSATLEAARLGDSALPFWLARMVAWEPGPAQRVDYKNFWAKQKKLSFRVETCINLLFSKP